MSTLNGNLLKKLALMVPVVIGLSVAGVSAAGSSSYGDRNPNQIFCVFDASSTGTGIYGNVVFDRTPRAIFRTDSNIIQTAEQDQFILTQPGAYEVYWEVGGGAFRGGEYFGLSYTRGGIVSDNFDGLDFTYTRTGVLTGTRAIISDTIVTSTGGTRIGLQNVSTRQVGDLQTLSQIRAHIMISKIR